ncbi:response regulator transcription factor [Oceanospirillum linum]|uniref:response regulator transcription factor n=2 Tax=Oceanospirillum linum TaxID=966 RepID=UPI00089EB57A|nr:response regulator [Oceanospirillum linum]SEG48258.1 Response regulator receiver domain-containing protein [Oleiphilus messinensis]SMP31223.1 Response regulator receiver domain-containing protein [Oceanospirillum linum]
MNDLTLLIVDDDEMHCEMVSDMLEGEYKVHTATTSEDTEALFEEHKPDLILLDINMPGKNGIDLCRELKKNDHEFSVIFVSGHNSLEERLKAYDAGGDDFVPKPFEMKELFAKVHAVGQYQLGKRSLKDQEAFSRTMAFQSMAEASQYGYVLQFFKNSMQADSLADVAKHFFEMMGNLNLVTSLQFHGKEIHSFDQLNGECSPIELNIFELLRGVGRLYDFDNRTILNDSHVSFLIKNMPVDDEVNYGRLRDVTAVIIEGLEAKYLDLERENALKGLLSQIQTIIDRLNTEISSHEGKMASQINNILLEIRGSFHELDLTLEQEEYFSKVIEKGLHDIDTDQNSLAGVQNALKVLAAQILHTVN